MPVYCEENSLVSLISRLDKVVNQLPDYRWKFVLVNDGSTDNSLSILRDIASLDDRVLVIDLSRNFGKEIALSAGVNETDSDAIICLDADLQHPPELIPRLIEKWENGAEIVETNRLSIDKQPMIRQLGSHLFYWVMNKISDVQMSSQTTDYRLFDKKVVDVFKQFTERERMFRGIFDWMGFHKAVVDFHADAREMGVAGYSYRKLFGLATNAITSFSLVPLKLAGYLGLLISVFSTLLLVWMLITRVFFDANMFTPLAFFVVGNTLLIGIVLIAIGLVALYIGNIHTEVMNRPLYIIRERIYFSN